MSINRLCCTGALIGFAVALWVGSAPAQTLFQEPVRTVDYTKYTEPDQCVWAANRVADSVSRLSTANWDTTPPGKKWRFDPWPSDARQVAQACSARWSETATGTGIGMGTSTAAITAYDFRWLFSLYLMADREADANAVFRRRETQTAESDSARAELLSTAVNVALAARPLRLATADSLWRQLIQFPDSVVADTVKVYALLELRALATQVGDLERAQQLAMLAEEQVKKLGVEARKSRSFASLNLRYLVHKNNDFLHHAERMDSLRQSTQAYLTLRQEQQRGLRQIFYDKGVYDSIGKVVSNIEGDFIFPDTSKGIRSTLGKISIIWPFGPSCAQGAGQYCLPIVAALKRAKQRFPEIDITLLTHTIGSYRDQAPPPVVQEASLIRDWFLKTLDIPASLHIQETPFFRLPPVDGRLVNLTRNLDRIGHIEGAKYLGDGFSSKTVYVLDRDGRFVYEAELSARVFSEEAYLMDVLDVLTHRKN